jgi:hypothetical protein
MKNDSHAGIGLSASHDPNAVEKQRLPRVRTNLQDALESADTPSKSGSDDILLWSIQMGARGFCRALRRPPGNSFGRGQGQKTPRWLGEKGQTQDHRGNKIVLLVQKWCGPEHHRRKSHRLRSRRRASEASHSGQELHERRRKRGQKNWPRLPIPMARR